MAPILSLPKVSLDRIREAVAPAVVSIWEVDSSGSKKSFRSGFVFDHEIGRCVVLTLSKGLDRSRKIFVRFENGECFEGSAASGDKKSNLVAILVTDLSFEPKKVSLSTNEADRCDEVVHMGFFDEQNVKLNFSSGSVGLVGHLVLIRKEGFTRFSHCCSQKLHLLGGPVFNLRAELVGVNYSQRKEKNLFFAMDLRQTRSELEKLFGKNMELVGDIMKGVGMHKTERKAKRRKTQ